MKKTILILLLIAMLIFTLSCEAAPEEEGAAQQIPTRTRISGAFVATVHALLPDYVLDDVTPRLAFVSEFQERPFLVELTHEAMEELEAGEHYVFQVEELVLDIPIEFVPVHTGALFAAYPLVIETISPVDEQTPLGLEAMRLEVEALP